MKHTNFDENFEWANEYIVLFEARNQLIMFHRNILKNEEAVVMTQSLISKNKCKKQFWCQSVDYHQLLPHKAKIKRYQREQDNFKLFKAFFDCSVDEFFGLISEKPTS